MNIGKKTSGIPFLFGILCILVDQFGVYANVSCRASFQNLPPHTKLAKRQSSNAREIKLLCVKGYFFARGKSKAVVKCSKNGTIQNPIPSCRGCDLPVDINNGTKTFSRISLGSKVRYSCDVGFTLDGPPRRRCGKNLKWSGRVKPFCRRNKCPDPKMLPNGNVTTTDPSYHEDSTLSFECNEGYELRGEEDIVCRNNKWSERFPYCRKKKCRNPGRPDNGRTYGNVFYIGSTVQFFCNSGFTLYGSSKRTCQKDQTWSGILTTCDDGRFHCREPGIPIDSVKKGKVYNLGNIVKYHCKSGFRLEGSNNRTCLSNKTWSGVQPKCVDKNYRVFPSINETMQFFREGFVDSLLQTTCSGKNVSCPMIDARARTLHLKYKTGLDLIFVLDTSSSIKINNFVLAKSFIKKIVEIFGVDGERDDGTKIACVTYGTTANLEFNFDHASVRTKDKALKRIEKIAYTRGATATRLALKTVKELVLPHRRNGSIVALFLITDGDSNVGGSPNKLAKELRNKKNKVEIYVVGIGKRVKHQSLKQLASGGGDKKHVFAVKNYEILEKVGKWITELKDYSKCGLVHYNPYVNVRARVVGGEVVPKRERWPWAVKVWVNGKQHCGGTLISLQYILTAAHCFFRGNALIPCHNIQVILASKKDLHILTCQHYYIHPSYNKKTLYNDIALIKIPKLKQYSRHKQAICLPQGLDMTKIIKTGDSLFAVGWGATEKTERGKQGNIFSESLKQVKIPFSDDKKCTDKVKNKNDPDWYFNNTAQFCAADPSGQNDTCTADSGGPAMVLHNDPQTGKLSWYQVGIVSWGDGCAQKGEYGFYTKVSAFLGWIDKYIKS